jgi:serine/threonine-protein kinase
MSPYDVLGGRYELEQPIGRGGSGEVWRALDRSLGRPVAVKVVDVPAADDTVVRRFRHEARAAAALSHPHVVGIHDADVDAARAYLVMELLPGPTLAALLRDEGPLALERAVDLAAQAASGLEAVHRAGLVHRDVKPGNLVLDQRGQVKIVDFGIARLVEATGTQVTASGTVVGSAGYLSPEQARGGPATPASDHYALGCTLMTLLTGEQPFAGEHPLAVLRQHIDEPPPRVRDRRPDVPHWLDELVDDLLAKDPARRQLGVAALLAHRAVDGGTKVMPAVPPSPTVPPPPPARRSPRVPVAAIAAAAAAVLALVVLVVLLLQGDGSDDPADAASDATSAPTSPTPEASETPTDSPPAATPPPSTPSDDAEPGGQGDLATAIAELRSAIDDSAASGDLDGKLAEDLAKKLEDLDKAVEEDKPGKDVDKVLDDLEKKLGDGVEKGEASADAVARISAAVEQVRSAA